ncbi:MAG: 2-succinyl-5-enolpyruvyl-6-hydroxy-3-cyclohexene-1-carboxylate synthase, partial [Archangium sp.]|nr:2-succinyl-5-enolpyruvyl-6-hydroxy-3-cyclohexene-1-carboxylate synthase [Archangium sp.]
FEFLPVASKSKHFERLFATPHGTDFAHVAQLAGARLHRPTTLKDATSAIAQGLEGGLHLIEIRTERRANVEAHRSIMASLTRGLA